MILGLSLGAFTLLHVLISLVGIASGLVVLFGMVNNRRLPGWTEVFLATTVLTSATGFLFPLTGFGPPEVIGTISLIALAGALFALYGRKLSGAWRVVYVVTAVLSLYFNVFVGLVQAFQKVAFMHALAPKGSEPPFLVAQLVLLAAFVFFGYRAVKQFHPAAA
jgi:hypothetical protein